jgi:16S rRNA (guanine527-N7)-methyltransferase
MTEEEARLWLADNLYVPRGTMDRLQAFVDLLIDEAALQNLVSQSTIPNIWGRHIVDSAQIQRFAPGSSDWIDLGSGAGFPGLVIAAISDRSVTLVESRRKRVEFLARAAETLGVSGRVTIAHQRAELVPERPFAVISARAFAPLEKLFAIGARFAGPETIWTLPKGRGAQAELDAVRRTWQGVFRIEPSITDPDSSILIAEQVRPREQR